MYRTEMVVSGLYCGHCVMELEGALSEAGAFNIEIEPYSGKTVFVTEKEPDISMIVKAVKKFGFEPHGVDWQKIS